MAFDETVLAGTTGWTIDVLMRDSSTGLPKTGIDAADVQFSYVRAGGAAPTEWYELSSSTWQELSSTYAPGLYRLTVPDGAVASGAHAVTLFVSTAGAIPRCLRIGLINANLRDATRLGLSALPNAAAGSSGGLPTVDANNAVKLQAGSGANQILLNNGQVTVGTNSDKSGYSLSGAALTDVAAAVWDRLTSAITTAGSIGKYLLDKIVGTIASGTHHPQSGDSYARLGTPAGASIAADIAGVKQDTVALAGMASEWDGMVENGAFTAAALQNSPVGSGGFTQNDRDTIQSILNKANLISASGFNVTLPYLMNGGAQVGWPEISDFIISELSQEGQVADTRHIRALANEAITFLSQNARPLPRVWRLSDFSRVGESVQYAIPQSFIGPARVVADGVELERVKIEDYDERNVDVFASAGGFLYVNTPDPSKVLVYAYQALPHLTSDSPDPDPLHYMPEMGAFLVAYYVLKRFPASPEVQREVYRVQKYTELFDRYYVLFEDACRARESEDYEY